MKAHNTRITQPPEEEPISLAAAKLHLRIDHSDEDTLIARLIAVARTDCEIVSRRAFVTRTVQAQLDGWPRGDTITLPHPPLQSVTSVQYRDEDGDDHTFASANYVVDTHSEPGRIVLKPTATWPAEPLDSGGAITITYVAGYGNAAQVPAAYKQAMLLMVGHLYENREAVLAGQGVSLATLPLALDALLLADRGDW